MSEAASEKSAARDTPETRPVSVGGLERFSLVDWPGCIVATVFCQGCGWRCRYCHNPDLMPFLAADCGARDAGEAPDSGRWTWAAVRAWLRDRRGLLDGVVFSGGEPTLQAGLVAAVGQVREMGFRVGLHTGGPAPAALRAVLPLVDWVGFDFKAPFADYSRVTGRPGGEAARASLTLVLRSGVDHEVRTTWHPALLSECELRAMADTLVAAGARAWVLQRFRAEGCVDAALRSEPAGEPPVEHLARAGLVVTVR